MGGSGLLHDVCNWRMGIDVLKLSLPILDLLRTGTGSVAGDLNRLWRSPANTGNASMTITGSGITDLGHDDYR